MSEELSLFGDEGSRQPVEPVKPVLAEAPIADWLVDQLREALSARGLTTMAERQQVIEGIARRPIKSLRSLTRAEALRILSHVAPDSKAGAGASSSWDDRDEDTWIDRL